MQLEPAITTTEEASTAAEAPKAHAKGSLADSALMALKPQGKACMVTNGAGMYVVDSLAGRKPFRFDCCLDDKRDTLAGGRRETNAVNRTDGELMDLEYGAAVSLKDARALLNRAGQSLDRDRRVAAQGRGTQTCGQGRRAHVAPGAAVHVADHDAQGRGRRPYMD
ncbi:hypothetical protein [Paucibacter sp. DJ2R-2]|uniref:hypothetical protein n=1 Tax=Paucibacter sp. DJ2R-2 TaxID=2893558 RepID=UPI0021E5147E|nr:hypothetical protein [Paucibacter sp. DJ2R-2]MCV2422132.1 hypothetical protein [Paucibacter sp. DJ4R-1]MCV2440284.1 hypothetical protein [Paucibacter sp. DJ2R-2]